MAVMGGVNVSKNLITLKNATIYEVSAIDKSFIDQSKQILQNNESFEVDYDSSEFTENNIDEGFRTDNINYQFNHNENFIRKARAKLSSKRNNMAFPIISFF